jgi:spermidine synthase
METLHTLARHLGPRGEVVLRRRQGPGPDVEELIINGVFAMDSADLWTERQLAAVALATVHGRRLPCWASRRVLVGGLGLGYTAGELLAEGVGHLDVVEVEDCLVEWAYAGLTPTLAAVAADPRVALHTADVATVLTGRHPGLDGPWDAIVVDVDNGPDFLIHSTNAGLYSRAGLTAAYDRLAEGGTLAIWCQGAAPDLLAALRRLSPSAQPHAFTRVRDGRTLEYVSYTVARGEVAAATAEQECAP